ncbi:MAG TPA: NAD(P)-dependent oxidoreductase [Chloroflexota bacterium]|nr:NAD(P)-dependent oxidoreductase [Chloroflexota bacterium]
MTRTSTARTARPTVCLALPSGKRKGLFRAAAWERLRDLAEVLGPYPGNTPPAEDAARADVLAGPGGVKLDAAGIAELDRLRWVAGLAGSAPKLDYAAAWSRGVVVSRCGPAFAHSVAEMALGMYICLARDLLEHNRALHTADGWEGTPKEENRQASYRTIGIVGLGSLGQEFARMVRVLEPSRLLAHDPFARPEVAADLGVQLVPLDELLRTCDVVVVMAASTPENRKVIGAAALDLLRPGALFINVSRSHLVDYAALAERLGDPARRLKAALDVFDVEPLPPAGQDRVAAALRGLDNVLLTPHRAGGTREAYLRIGDEFVIDIERYVRGEPPETDRIVDEAVARRQGVL